MAIEGMKEILASFDRLEKAAQARAMRSALNASMTPVVKAVRQAAPKGTEAHRTYKGRLVAPGFLSRSVKKSTRIGRDKDRVFGNVRLASEAWYGSLLEYGYRPGKRSKGVKKQSRSGSLSDDKLKQLGDKRKKKAGKPWFGPAVDRVDDEAAEAFMKKMGDAIVREWLK